MKPNGANMKPNGLKKYLGLALIAGLLLGGGYAGTQLFDVAPVAAAQDSACVDDEAAEGLETADTDTVEEEVECGSEDEAGEQDEGDEVAPADWTGLTADEAKSLAEAAHPGTTATKAEFEQEGDTYLYEVELDDGTEVYLDALTGEISNVESDSD